MSDEIRLRVVKDTNPVVAKVKGHRGTFWQEINLRIECIVIKM